MWYFAWVHGVAAALSLDTINVMWFEFQNEFDENTGHETTRSSRSDCGRERHHHRP